MLPQQQILSEPVSVLMPIYNEVDLIRDVVEEWAHDVFSYLPKGSELVFDDCSDDGTNAILSELAATKYSFIRIERGPRDGFDRAAKRLYAGARCPLIFFTDSDGQYVAADFWKVAEKLEGHDLVHGHKVNRQDPLYRIAASAVLNQIVAWMFSSHAIDVNSAFRMMRRSLVVEILPTLCRVPMLPNAEMYIRAERLGYKVINVPVRHRKRMVGVSRGLPPKAFIRHGWNALVGLLALRRDLQ